MKKIIIFIMSLLTPVISYCQERFLHLKSIDAIHIQSWDTLYVTFDDKNVIVKDEKGEVFKFEIDKKGVGEYGSDLVISEHNRYHACGDLEKGPCRRGVAIMDKKMKLYFDNNSQIYNSSHRDHGSHHSHASYTSHYSSR